MKPNCPKPLRDPASCFVCGQLGHQYRDCPNGPNRPGASNRRGQVAAVSYPADNLPPAPQNWHEEDDEEDDEQLAARQNVSTTFIIDKDRRAVETNLSALLDTGSPVSFVCRTAIAKGVECGELRRSGFHGLGNTPLYTFGKISLYIRIGSMEELTTLCVLPAGILPVPLLLGRDVLLTFGIGLQFSPKIKDASRHSKLILKNSASRIVDNKETDVKTDASRRRGICSVAVKNWREIKQINSINFDKRSYYCTLEFINKMKQVASCHINVVSKKLNGPTDLQTIRTDLDVSKNETNCVLKGIDFENNGIVINRQIDLGTRDITVSEQIDESWFILNIEPDALGQDELDIGREFGRKYADDCLNLLTDYSTKENVEAKPAPIECHLNLTSKIPIYQHARRLSYYERSEVDKMVDSLIEQGIVRPSESPYASPIVLVKNTMNVFSVTNHVIHYQP